MEGHFRLHLVEGMFQVVWGGGHVSGCMGWRECSRLLGVEGMFQVAWGVGHVPGCLGMR